MNWGHPANVEFDLVEENENDQRIVGKASCDIKQGEELFQQYGNSVAEVVYRCGFAPTLDDMEGGDVVSITMSDMISFAADKLSIKGISHLSSRIQALKQAGAIDESPWDGMDDCLTAELSRSSEAFLSSQLNQSKETGNSNEDTVDRTVYDDGGVSKLIGIILVLLADDSAWERASIALQNVGTNADSEDEGDNVGKYNDGKTDSEGDENDSHDEDESRTDDITAAVLLSSIANLSPQQSTVMKQIALDVGLGGHDPWRALLLHLFHIDNGTGNDGERDTKRQKIHQEMMAKPDHDDKASTCIHWSLIFEAATEAVRQRMNISLEGRALCKELLDSFETKPAAKKTENKNKSDENSKSNIDKGDGEDLGDEEKMEAINTISILRDVEESILGQAMEVLAMTSHEISSKSDCA